MIFAKRLSMMLCLEVGNNVCQGLLQILCQGMAADF